MNQPVSLLDLNRQVQQQKRQIAELEVIVDALLQVLVTTTPLRLELKDKTAGLLESLESSPPGRLSEYSNEDRVEISANVSEYLDFKLPTK